MATAATTRSDAETQRDVLEELRWDAAVAPTEVAVVVRDAVVTLSGQVDSYARRWAAERAARRLRGVRAVANEIEVRLTGSVRRTDGDLAVAAVRALEWDAFVPAEGLDVTVSGGWITLRGEVEWGYQRISAERALRGLRGVRGVTNLVAVRPGVPVEPDETARDIREALTRTSDADVGRLVIDVHGETVVLAGGVRSWAEREEVERAAWSARGVCSVETRLDVAA